MGRFAIHPSAALAELMRERRIQMGMSLRDVQRATEEAGSPIPYATLSRVEQGKVDPGVKRLHVLLRLYQLPVQLAADLLDIEQFASPPPPASTSLSELRLEGVEHWQEGRLQEGMSCFLAVRSRQSNNIASRTERQKALLSFSIAAKNLGKIRLAHQIVENLLLERPEPSLLVNVLVQGATCWHQLGSPEAALGFLSEAETHLADDEHKQNAWILHERARIFLSMDRDAEAILDLAEAAYARAEDPYGRCQVKGLRIRAALAREDGPTALTLALEAQQLARDYDFQRLRILRSIDVGRARFLVGETDEGLRVLQAALGEAIAEVDHVLSFHAHHALWKAYSAVGDNGRADLELCSAEYYSRFVDEHTPEVFEVRDADQVRKSNKR